MTLRDLIDQLSDFAAEHGDQTEVRLAHQPSWPLEYSIGEIAATDDATDHRDDEQSVGVVHVEEEPVVYIGEGRQLGYLGGAATRALGWRE